MSYSYIDHRSTVFTEEGQERVLKVIRKARQCLEIAGAVSAGTLMHAAENGLSWDMMAAVDRLEELKMLREVTDHGKCAWQDRVFVAGSAPL